MLKKANISWNARQLGKMIGKGTIKFDNAVQRGLVWDKNRKSLLIHSMLENYPIPPMYAAKAESCYDFLDGKQRTNCINDFLNDKFELVNIPVVTLEDGTEVDINGKKFSELPEELRDVISNYSLTIYYFEDITDEQINELFFRLNNGKPLSSIELSRSKAKCLTTIQEIGKHELFTTALTEKAFERYAHEDLVIKSYIMLTHKSPCYDTKVVRPVMETAVFTEEDINNLNAVYDRILEVYKEVIADTSTETGKLSKKVAKRIITKTHMLSIIPIVKRSIEDGVSVELFTAWVKNFFCGTKSPTKYDKYNNKATSGSGHIEAVKARLDVIKTDYAKFMKEHKNDVFEKVETNVEETAAETVETVAEEITETTVETEAVKTEAETVEVIPEMVEATETTEEVIEMANETEVEEVNVAEKSTEFTEEDDVPESVRAILEAAGMEENLAEAV